MKNNKVDNEGIFQGGYVIENTEKGYTNIPNNMFDVWIRVLGLPAWTIWQTFRRFCPGEETRPFPNIRMTDWAAFIGIGLEKFRVGLKTLQEAGILVIEYPTGQDRLLHKPVKYTLYHPELTEELKAKTPPLPDNCMFEDPIHSKEEWPKKMFRRKNQVTFQQQEVTKDSDSNKLKKQISAPIENTTSAPIENTTCNYNNTIYNNKIDNYSNNYLNNFSKEKLNFCSFDDCNCNCSSNHTCNCKSTKISNSTKFLQICKTRNIEPEYTPNLEHALKLDEQEDYNSQSQGVKERFKQVIKTSKEKIKALPNPIIEYWNSLDNVQKHKNPTTKTYKQIIKYINQLRTGKFPISVNLDSKWVNKYKIEVNKKFSDDEIKETFVRLSHLFVQGYFPQNKTPLPKSLSDLIYNPRTRKSWFLYVWSNPPRLLSEVVPSEAEEGEFAMLLNRFNDLCPKGIKENRGKVFYNIKKMTELWDNVPIEYREYGIGCIPPVRTSNSPTYRVINSYLSWLEEVSDFRIVQAINESDERLVSPDFWVFKFWAGEYLEQYDTLNVLKKYNKGYCCNQHQN